MPPQLTADERAEKEARDRKAAAEREAIRRALAATGDSRTEAAKLLDISRKTLWEKMTKLGMNAEE